MQLNTLNAPPKAAMYVNYNQKETTETSVSSGEDRRID